jgi:hypothetical protein
VGLPRKFNVHLCQKVPFVLARKLRLEQKKDALCGLDTQSQMTILGYVCVFTAEPQK